MFSQEEKETEREACDRASSTASARPDIANVRRTLRKSKLGAKQMKKKMSGESQKENIKEIQGNLIPRKANSL